MLHKRINKVIISGYSKNPEFNDGYGIYKYTDNCFLDSYSRFCNEVEKPWWIEKYINDDSGLPIKRECFLMGDYVRYDTYEYRGNDNIKWSVYDLKEGLSSYVEIDYENGKFIKSQRYSKNGELIQSFYAEYDHLGRKTKILEKSLDDKIIMQSVYEYDNDVLLARIDNVLPLADPDSECGIIRNQFSWEEKECSVNLLNWFI